MGSGVWGGVSRGTVPRWGCTCAGSPERRASGTGLFLEVGLVRARPLRQRPAPPQSIRTEPPEPGDPPEPPSSAAARVAEAREGRVEGEREL